MLARIKITPPVKTIYGEAEKLSKQFTINSFDIVYSSNALDHTCDPFRSLQEMIKVVKEGGGCVFNPQNK